GVLAVQRQGSKRPTAVTDDADAAPAPAAIAALEYAAVDSAAACRRIERGRRLGVDGQGKHIGVVGQAGVDGAPAHPAIGALEYAVSRSGIDRGRCLGVDG